jgi:hypothetical protein
MSPSTERGRRATSWGAGALLLLVLAAAPAAAQDRLDALAAAVNGATASADAAAVERIARLLGVRADNLRAARTASRLGWGDLFVAHRLATLGGHPVEKVVAARRTGAGWSTIADEGRVEPATLEREVIAAWPESAKALATLPPRAAPEEASPPPPAAPPAPTAPGAEPAAAAAPAPGPPVALPPGAEPERKRSWIFDFFRGRPAERGSDSRAPAAAAEEIRDRILRESGTRGR